MKTKPKLLFIYTCWNQNEYRHKNDLYGGVGYYRIVKPAEYLSKWFEIDVYGKKLQDMAKGIETAKFYHDLVKDYDAVVIKHIDNPQAASALSFMCNYLGVPLIIDLDDNLMEVREDQPAYKDYKAGEKTRAYAMSFIGSADALFLSTKPLADSHKKMIKDIFKKKMPVYVLPNCNDRKEFHKRSKENTDKIVIGWQGSTTHNADLKIVIPMIGKLLDKYDNLYFELMGGIEKKSLKDLFGGLSSNAIGKIDVKGGTLAWKGYPQLLGEQKWDIGIAPLVNDEFNRSKSHIKWMEYAVNKIPCVASRVYPYCEDIQGTPTIENNVTGMLCNNTEWEQALTQLIESKKLREDIANNAYMAVIKNWQWEDHIDKWKKAINDVIKNYKPNTHLREQLVSLSKTKN